MQWKDVTDHVNDYQCVQFFLKLLPKTSENKDRVFHDLKINFPNIPKYNFLYKVFSKKPLFILFHYAYEIAAYFLFLKNKHQLK